MDTQSTTPNIQSALPEAANDDTAAQPVTDTTLTFVPPAAPAALDDATTETAGDPASDANTTGSTAEDVVVNATDKVARFTTKQIVVEQEVPLPGSAVEWARNGSRKNSSKWTRALGDTAVSTLSPAACGLFADTVIDVPRLIAMARDNHTTETAANNLVLRQVVNRVLAGGILYLENERVGHVTRTQIKPATQAYAPDGTMLAEAQREVASFDALRAAVFETVKHTLDLGGAYQESIVATGVIDPVLVRPTRTVLKAENVCFTALETVDGTTRAITDLSVLLNTTRAETIADFVIDAHFNGHVQAHDGEEVLDITDEVRSNIRAAQRGLDNAYWSHAADRGHDDPHALRMQQALTLPANLTLGVEARGATARTFVEALDVLVRNTHINRMQWLNQAQANNLAKAVVTALIENGAIDDDVADLLVASTPAQCRAALAPFGYTGAEDVDATLWRAVVLLSVLTRPSVRTAAKKAIGQALTLSRVMLRRYAAVLSLLIDLPWREAKAKSAGQAHRAWERGGALLREMHDGGSWTPVIVANAEDLVNMEGRDARLTLAALGGVALIADRFITSDAVAGTGDAGKVRMPYKVASVNTLVEMLARETNTDGRRQLAAAAVVFDPVGESSSPWRAIERRERAESRTALKISNAKALAEGRDDDVLPLPVYYETPAVSGGDLRADVLMTIADHDSEMTNKHKATTSKATGAKPDTPKSPLEQVIATRERAMEALKSAIGEIASLRTLAEQHSLPAFNPSTHPEAMVLSTQITANLYSLAPTGDDLVGGDLAFDDNAPVDDVNLDADEPTDDVDLDEADGSMALDLDDEVAEAAAR